MLSNPFLLFFYLPPFQRKKVCCLVLFFFLGTTAPHYRSSFFFSSELTRDRIDTNMATLSVRQDFPSQWRRPKTTQKKACTQKMMYIERKKTDTHTQSIWLSIVRTIWKRIEPTTSAMRRWMMIAKFKPDGELFLSLSLSVHHLFRPVYLIEGKKHISG